MHTHLYKITALFIQKKGEGIYTVEPKGLGEGALEKKIKSLQPMLSHEAIMGRPMKLQGVRNEKARKYLTDRAQKQKC